MNLLESAGFSRSNPYYIVKQGRVSYFIPTINIKISFLQVIVYSSVQFSLIPFQDNKLSVLKFARLYSLVCCSL